MRSYRKLIAPISVTLLILIAGLAFINSRPSFVGPPPILDPNFELWVGDPGARRLMLWDLKYVKGARDNVSLQETVVNGKRATQFLVMHNGGDAEPVVSYLTQIIDGARLTGLLNDDIGVWVLAEPCACSGTSTTRSVIFGVEVNDGLHTLTFIFSERANDASTILAHRFVYLLTEPGAWTYQHINVTREYTLAQWSLPVRLTFSLVFEVGGYATGWHSAYVNSFTWRNPQLDTTTYASYNVKQTTFSLNSLQCFDLGRFRVSYSVAKV
jgi:hypothetical protein